MRIIKNLLIGLIGLSLLVTLLSLLFSSTIKVNRDIIINANSSQVLPYINDPAKWISWYAPLSDSNLSSTGRAGIVRSPQQIQWVDDSGKLNSILIKGSDTTTVELEFTGSSGKKLTSVFILHSLDNGLHTRVEWQSLLHLGWLPWQKFSGIVAENMIAPVIETSLQNLKTVAERESTS